jgi:nucleotide-binding universal stress UspA family protein
LNTENIEAKTEVLEGEVAENIIRYAEENDTDLVMIGNRGLGGLKKLVLGSVSQKVVQKASCPVLVVK